MRRALITGAGGQDGVYLAELLLSHGYTVHGLFRPGESGHPEVLRHEALLQDECAVRDVVAAAAPTECYHLGGRSFVTDEESATMHVNACGTLHVFKAIRREAPRCRVFFAGSAEAFGNPEVSPQDETTALRPRNIYGITKVAGQHLTTVYREHYGLFACCGILFNHESPRRGPHFVTRKITIAAARIAAGLQSELVLGNLTAIRDWGHARDYVRGMWLMLQASEPDDYVLATGEGHTVQDFAAAAFEEVGLDWRDYVRTDPSLYRPANHAPLIGSARKARVKLGWAPEFGFADLVREMVRHDVAEVRSARAL